jgi:hypothetical protein
MVDRRGTKAGGLSLRSERIAARVAYVLFRINLLAGDP